MIFVGEGALLWRAVQHTLDSGLSVDLVCSPPSPGSPPSDVPFLATTDINTVAGVLFAASTDGLIWSVNNRMIFRPSVLATGLRILNIHHGPLPSYRGMPEVALAYAMLRGEREYAATLHRVDEGIDTGRPLAAETYPIGANDPYHVVMCRGLQVCHRLFERCLPLLAADLDWPGETGAVRFSGESGYFGRTALTRLPDHRGHPEFSRATDLGFLAAYLPELAEALA